VVVVAAIVVILVCVAVKVVSVVVTVIARTEPATRFSALPAWSGTVSPPTATGSAVGCATFQPQPPPCPDVAVQVGRQVLFLKQNVGAGSTGVGVASGAVYVVVRWQ
jgi:hypothetical protein